MIKVRMNLTVVGCIQPVAHKNERQSPAELFDLSETS